MYKKKSKTQADKVKSENKLRVERSERLIKGTGNWRLVDGYDTYLIFDDGRVFSRRNGKLLANIIREDGYAVVSLWKNNKGKSFYVHRLVIEHFGDGTVKETVNHIDGIKSNNHISNLEWMTYAENNKHAVLTGLNTTEHKRNKKGSIAVRKSCLDGNIIKTYPSMRQAQRETGVSAASIGLGIKNGWNYGGYQWSLVEE